jgi:hypothetical protein
MDDVPEDFPRDIAPGVVSGAQPKICVVRSNETYVAGQTDQERYERWAICEDLVTQLRQVAVKDAAKHPGQALDVTLERIRVSVARKGWVSKLELHWIMRRLRSM